MAEHRLDAIVHKAVVSPASRSSPAKGQWARRGQHRPSSLPLEPPYVNHKGAPHLNTFLVYVPTVTVPAGFTTDGLPRRHQLPRTAL